MSEQGRIFSRNNGSSVRSLYKLFFQFLGHFFKNFQQDVVEQDFQEFVICEIVLKRESVNSPSWTLYLLWVGKLSKLDILPSHSAKKWKNCPKLKKNITKVLKIEVLFYLPCSPIELGNTKLTKNNGTFRGKFRGTGNVRSVAAYLAIILNFKKVLEKFNIILFLWNVDSQD